ncbi:hypothetical protein PENSPDRAFT_688160 [Peniophora sp. CONT]|nr:hypothetical protein PENSPDRAFT_688160 [Peniophora sp. CONT]
MAVLVADVTMMNDDIMAEDEKQTILGSYLAPLTQAHTIAPQSTTELMLGRETIGLRFEVDNDSPPWALTQSSSERAYRLLRDDLSLPADVVDENWAPVPDQWASGSVGGGRLWVCNWIDVSKYVNLLPLTSIDILSLVPNVVSLFATAEAWMSAFGVARRVERLSASYLRCIDLFSALTRISDGTGEPSLFPRLSTLVFVAERYILDEHQALSTAADIYLKDILLVRKEAGAPIRHIYVDKTLSSWSIWAEVDCETVVSFFE